MPISTTCSVALAEDDHVGDVVATAPAKWAVSVDPATVFLAISEICWYAATVSGAVDVPR